LRQPRKRLPTLVVYAADASNQTLSYQVGWPHGFAAHPRFDCDLVNVRRTRGLSRIRALLGVRGRRYRAIVMLHSVFSNERTLYGEICRTVARSTAVKAYFIGNEFKLMPEKMAFCEELGIDLLVSMAANPSVRELYRQRLGCRVVEIPSAGVDPGVFFPRTPMSERTVDLGYRADAEPMYFGHQDRTVIAEHFLTNAAPYRLRLDVTLDPAARFAREAYAAFLNRCIGQLGTEAGTNYFDLEDSTRNRVNAYLAHHPDADLDELGERIFDRVERTPARMMSGRHSEAAATKTVQILFEGGYNGIFRPDVHYIALRKDFSNVGDVLERFRDEAARREIAENAYVAAHEQLSYAKLIDRFHAALGELL